MSTPASVRSSQSALPANPAPAGRAPWPVVWNNTNIIPPAPVVPPGPSLVPITALQWGTPFKYNSNYPTHWIQSDVWASTWADDDQIYAINDDTFTGWQGAHPGGSNLSVSLLSDYTTSLIGSNVNYMTIYGTITQLDPTPGGDNASYKAMGIISVAGVLYIVVARHVSANTNGVGTAALQPFFDAQIIKSTNHGLNWTPVPPATAVPFTPPVMFPGPKFGSPYFVQYGKNYAGLGATPGALPDNANNYLYAVSVDKSYWCSDNAYLGRVALNLLPNLNGADWHFWQGGDGMLDASWGPLATAAPILSRPTYLSTTGIQYLPAFNSYVWIQWYWPSVPNNVVFDSTTSRWDVYQAPHPWGPWTLVGGRTNGPATPGGFYGPLICPKSVAQDGGNNVMVFTSGNFQFTDPQTGEYTLTLVPLAINPYVPPPPPTVTTNPAVSGTAAVGATLTCTQGQWSNNPTSYAYQWVRDGTTNIGTNSNSYTVIAADQGHAIRCVVTATNPGGSTTAPASNAISIPAAAQAPSNTTLPAITGSTTLGATLTCSQGQWTNPPITGYAYQWRRDVTTNIGTGASTYVIVAADQGHSLSCVVTATNAQGSSSAASNAVAIPAGYSAAVQQWFNRCGTLDATHTSAYQALIDGLVADGLWSTIDTLWMLATDTESNALLNLKSASFPCTKHGLATAFSVNHGYTGVAGSATDYIDTGYNPTTAGGNATQNSTLCAVWVLGTYPQSSNSLYGWYDGTNTTQLIANTGSSLVYFWTNEVANPGMNCNGNFVNGSIISERFGSNINNDAIWINGARITPNNSGSPSSAPANLSYYLLNRHDVGAISNGNAAQVAAFCIAGIWTDTQALAWHNRVNTYLTAVGAH